MLRRRICNVIGKQVTHHFNLVLRQCSVACFANPELTILDDRCNQPQPLGGLSPSFHRNSLLRLVRQIPIASK